MSSEQQKKQEEQEDQKEQIRFASYTEEEEEAWKQTANWYDAGGNGDTNADQSTGDARGGKRANRNSSSSGELLLLVGPACAGKSTFSRILGRVLRANTPEEVVETSRDAQKTSQKAAQGVDGKSDEGQNDEGRSDEQKPAAQVPPIRAMLMDVFHQETGTNFTKPKAFLNLDGDLMRDAHAKWQEYVRETAGTSREAVRNAVEAGRFDNEAHDEMRPRTTAFRERVLRQAIDQSKSCCYHVTFSTANDVKQLNIFLGGALGFEANAKLELIVGMSPEAVGAAGAQGDGHSSPLVRDLEAYVESRLAGGPAEVDAEVADKKDEEENEATQKLPVPNEENDSEKNSENKSTNMQYHVPLVVAFLCSYETLLRRRDDRGSSSGRMQEMNRKKWRSCWYGLVKLVATLGPKSSVLVLDTEHDNRANRAVTGDREPETEPAIIWSSRSGGPSQARELLRTLARYQCFD